MCYFMPLKTPILLTTFIHDSIKWKIYMFSPVADSSDWSPDKKFQRLVLIVFGHWTMTTGSTSMIFTKSKKCNWASFLFQDIWNIPTTCWFNNLLNIIDFFPGVHIQIYLRFTSHTYIHLLSKEGLYKWKGLNRYVIPVIPYHRVCSWSALCREFHTSFQGDPCWMTLSPPWAPVCCSDEFRWMPP